MTRYFKALILGTAVIATLATSFETASADWRDRGYHGRNWHYHHGPGWGGNAVAAGVLGLAAGAIVGEALSQPHVIYRDGPVYVEPDDGGPDVEYLGPVDGYADPDDVYVEPAPHRVVRGEDYYPARPQQRVRTTNVADQSSLEPWTAKWRTYCKQRYSTFNSSTGTYTGYDGRSHFCTAG